MNWLWHFLDATNKKVASLGHPLCQLNLLWTVVYSQERRSSEHGLTARLTMRQEMVESPSFSCTSCCSCCWWCGWWWWLWWWWGWFPSSLLGPRPLSLLESQLFGEQFSSSIRSLMNATTGLVLFDIGCRRNIYNGINQLLAIAIVKSYVNNFPSALSNSVKCGGDRPGGVHAHVARTKYIHQSLKWRTSWRVTTYVSKPSDIGQPTRPTPPFILSGFINK